MSVVQDVLLAHRRHTQTPESDEYRDDFFFKVCNYLQGGRSAQEHVLHCIPEVTVELLGLFSIEDAESSKTVGGVMTRMAMDLRACATCIETYHDSKDIFYRRYRDVYTERTVNDFMDGLLKWDIARQRTSLRELVSQIKTIAADAPKQKLKEMRRLLLNVLSEICMYPETLQDREVDKAWVSAFHALEESGKPLQMRADLQFTGAVIATAHADEGMRIFGRRSVRNCKERIRLGNSELNGFIVDLMIIVSENGTVCETAYNYTHDLVEIWKALSAVVGKMDDQSYNILRELEKAAGVDLDAMVGARLLLPTEDFWEVLNLLTTLLTGKGRFPSAEGRIELLRGILDNQKFDTCMRTDSAVEKLSSMYLRWLLALCYLDNEPALTDKTIDMVLTQSTAWCEKALKLLSHILINMLWKRRRLLSTKIVEEISFHLMQRVPAKSQQAKQLIDVIASLLSDDLASVGVAEKSLEYLSDYLCELMDVPGSTAQSYSLFEATLQAAFRWTNTEIVDRKSIVNLISEVLTLLEMAIELYTDRGILPAAETDHFQKTVYYLLKCFLCKDEQISRLAFKLTYEMIRISWRMRFNLDENNIEKLRALSSPDSAFSYLSALQKQTVRRWLKQNDDVRKGSVIPPRPDDAVFTEKADDDRTRTMQDSAHKTSENCVKDADHTTVPQSAQNLDGWLKQNDDARAKSTFPSRPDAVLSGKAVDAQTSTMQDSAQKTSESFVKKQESAPSLQNFFKNVDDTAVSAVFPNFRDFNGAKKSSIQKSMNAFISKSHDVRSVWEQLAADAGKPSYSISKKGPSHTQRTGPSKLQQLRNQAVDLRHKTSLLWNETVHKPPIPRPLPPVGLTSAPALTEVVVLSKDDSGSSWSDKPRRTHMIDVDGITLPQPARGKPIRIPGQPERPTMLRDIQQLYKVVLSWNLDMEGDCPEDAKLPPSSGDTFCNDEEWVAVFEPLLILECWAQLQQAREEIRRDDALAVNLTHVQNVDEFHEISLVAGAHDVRMKGLNEHDIVQMIEADGKLINIAPKRILSKVQNVSYRNNNGFIRIRVFVGKNTGLIASLRLNSRWLLQSAFSLTTSYREWTSICHFPTLPLRAEILQNRKTVSATPHPREVSIIKEKFGLNEPQAMAICAAKEKEQGFVLIQGPPGSGKTTTIMGLISTFLKTNQATLITVPGSTSQAKKPRNRLLVCAPSNAAIDEIVRRLKQGIRDGKGGTFVPKMVRLGTSDAIHSAVRDVTLDALVDIELKANPQYAFKDADEEEGRSEDVRRRIAILKDDRESLRARESGSNDASEAKEINDKIATISKRLGALQDELVKEKEKRGTSALARDRFRRACRLKLLSESDVILSTLSASGHDVLAEINELEFPTVIIDEACQSVELSTLIPLRYGAKKCILVGDPNQLPPTVLSTVAQEYGYERSLFERIMNNNPQSVHLLSIQYRMHPDISRFPSQTFYGGNLADAPDMERHRKAAWHFDKSFPPYHVYDISEGREATGKGHSYFNSVEAKLCVDIVESLCARYPNINFSGKIGIITFYKLQVRKIKDELIRRFSREVLNHIDVNTVDGFQGQEKEIVILSCVRANDNRGVGFTSDVRRMNVSLTRSKYSLWILGSCATLRTNRVWRNLIESAEDRNMLSKLDATALKQGGRPSVPQNIFASQRENTEPPDHKRHREDSFSSGSEGYKKRQKR